MQSNAVSRVRAMGLVDDAARGPGGRASIAAHRDADLGVGHPSTPLRRILVAADRLALTAGWSGALLVAFAAGVVAFGPLTVVAQTIVVLGAGILLFSASGLPEEVALFDDALNARARVKPGVTGLWQVEARDLSSFDLYRRYDLLYVQHWSPGVDLAVIARTVVVVVLRAGRAMRLGRSRGAEVVT